MDAVLRDLRYAVRMLLRTPGVTAAAILALALGIGATTAIFSVVHAVLLRSLGWGEESRLVAIRGNFDAQNLIGIWVSVPEYRDLQQAPFLQPVGVYAGYTATLQAGDRAERVSVGYATGSFFTALGVHPVYGRNFTGDEDAKGRDDVALVTWATWQKRFGSDPSIVGRTVTLEGRPRTVIGILPAAFHWEQPHEFYLPPAFPPQPERGSRYLDAIARLPAGMSLPAASRALDEFSASIRKANPKYYPDAARWHLTLTPLRDRFVGSARQPLLLLLGAVFLVLLIACANVANLMLARGAARAREFAVRAALGAPRSRLVRQLLVESGILALVGAISGVLLSIWSLDLLLAAAPEAIRHLSDVRLDRAVLAFAAALTALTTILFGLVPALQSTRSKMVDALRDGGNASAGPSRERLRRALVVGQFALSLMLLLGAGLLLRSFAEVVRVRPGFEAAGVLSAQVTLGGARYESPNAQARYWADAIRRLNAIAGVEVAGAVSAAPLAAFSDWSYSIEGQQMKPGEIGPDDQLRQVTAGYFRAMRIPVHQGRDVSEGDDARAPLVLFVNEAWVRRFFPGQDVIGRRIRLDDDQGKPPRSIEGVVGDSHDLGLDTPTPPMLFAPLAQLPTDRMTLMVRTAGGQPGALAASVQSALAEVDRGQPSDWTAPFEQRIAGALAPRRFPLQLLGAFAVLAVVLSALGIYGVTAYAVTQRTKEIGVRIAVGAQQGDVLRMVMFGAMRLAAAGVAFGLTGALLGARLLSSQLYGVGSRDPLTYGGMSLLLAVVALAASWVPARRATRVDPMIALRAE